MKKEKDEELFLKELIGENLPEKEETDENFFGEELEHEEEPFEHEETFAEHEKEAIEKAVFELAKVLGKKPGEVSEILKKGEEFDGLLEKFGKSKGDSEIFEKLAEMRGISKEEMKEEILWALEKATTEKAVNEIMAANPGMNRETAKELALFRLELKKEKKTAPEEDRNEAMLSELEKFLAKHSGEGIEKLPNETVEEWEKGIPLETAFEKNRLFKENEKLFAEIEKMKNEKIKETQRIYAKEHAPGSGTSAAGVSGFDEFVEGLFKDY